LASAEREACDQDQSMEHGELLVGGEFPLPLPEVRVIILALSLDETAP
jgi:hypothetical protein